MRHWHRALAWLAFLVAGCSAGDRSNTSDAARLVEVECPAQFVVVYDKPGEDGTLPIVTLSPDWEAAFAEALIGQGDDKQLALAPSKLQEFIRAVRETFERAALQGESPVLLTSPMVRPYIRSIVERFRGQTVVISQNEVHPKARLKTLGAI